MIHVNIAILLAVIFFSIQGNTKTIVGVNAFPSPNEFIFSRSTNRTQVLRQMYEPLFLIDENYQLSSPYIDNWQVNADRTKFNFTLKKNQKFHNGFIIRPEHIAMIFRRRTPEGAPIFNNIKQILINNYVITVELKTPSYDFIEKMSDLPTSLILDKKDDFGYPIGSGAFKLVATSDSELTFERNTFHRDFKSGTIKTLAFQLLNESIYSINSLLQKDISFFPLVRVTDTNSQESKIKFKEVIYPSHRVNTLVLNIKDEQIRTLLSLCISPDQLLTLPYLKGSIHAYNSIIPPGIENYRPSITTPKWNLTQCLKQAKQIKRNITLRWLNSYDDPNDIAYLTTLVKSLNEKIYPLKVTLVNEDLTSVHQIVRKGDYEIFMCGVASPYPLAEGILSDFLYKKDDTNKLLKFEDKKFAELMKIYQSENGEKRAQSITNAVNHLIQSSWIIPIGRRIEKYLVPSNWKDLLLVNGMNGNFYLGKVKFENSPK